MLRNVVFTLILAVSIYGRQYFYGNVNMMYDSWLRNNELFNFMFPNYLIVQLLHIIGALFAFWSALLLKCNSIAAFLILFFQFIIPTPEFDCLYAFISFNLFVVTISVNSSYTLIKLLCNIVSGASVAGCILILPETYPLSLLSFFSYLFFWLRTHNISTPNLKLFLDALQTFISFVVSFMIAFFLESHLTSFPKISKEIYPLRQILLVFPAFRSKLFLISLPCLTTSHNSISKILYTTCFLCAFLFRIKPITTLDAGLVLSTHVSKTFYSIGSLIVVSGAESHTVMFLTIPIYLFVVILGFIFQF